MKRIIKTICMIAALSGFTAAANAQLLVWQDDFQNPANLDTSSAAGTYGNVAFNFSGSGVGDPYVCVTNDLLEGTNLQNGAFIFEVGTNYTDNFGLEINWLPTTGGNTLGPLRNYTLSFDVAVQGTPLNAIPGAFVGPTIGVYGNYGGEYYGDGAQTNVSASWFPQPGTGYQHVVMNMGTFGTAHATLLAGTDTPLTFNMQFYIAGSRTNATEEIDLENIQITMLTNLPPPPPPTVSIVPAKPALRVFSQNFAQTYNQEGFSTADVNQSWYGATPSAPVSYSITFKDFNTVNGYTLYTQLTPNASSGDPYGVYNGTNALVWSITAQSTGFTTAVNWKTNAPQGNENNNAISLTSASTNGLGTWTLSFTSSTNGTITCPDGTTGSFVLDPNMAQYFQNPMVIDFGTAPNSTAGYGQFIDFSKIAITNVVDGNEFDDFTQDSTLNTTLWNPGFSVDGGSVVQVATNTPYWIKWTTPDDGYSLEEAQSLNSTNTWYSPTYYGTPTSSVNTTPTLMGGVAVWTLIPSATFPTVDEVPGDAVSPSAFYRLSNPGPTQ